MRYHEVKGSAGKTFIQKLLELKDYGFTMMATGSFNSMMYSLMNQYDAAKKPVKIISFNLARDTLNTSEFSWADFMAVIECIKDQRLQSTK